MASLISVLNLIDQSAHHRLVFIPLSSLPFLDDKPFLARTAFPIPPQLRHVTQRSELENMPASRQLKGDSDHPPGRTRNVVGRAKC